MMAKKLQAYQKQATPAIDPNAKMKKGKVIATTGGKTKQVAKVKAHTVASKTPNPLVKAKTVKK